MKRIFLSILAIILCLAAFSGCANNQYKGPLSCITRIGADGVTALMDMTEDAHKTILSALNKGKWQDGVTNCGYDYEFTTKKETIRYHSECGTFIDMTNNKSMILSGQERLSINTILGASTNTVSEEEYDVSLAFPVQNQTFEVEDEPPTFYWTKNKGFPKSYIIEIDYMNDGTYMSKTVDVGITYLLSEEDWNTIKSNAPIVDGLQKINWRIRIDYTSDLNREPYYTGWTYFWIKQEVE